MKLFIGNSIVSCYVDIASLLVIVILLMLSYKVRRRDSSAIRMYRILCAQIGLTCIVCFMANVSEGHTSEIFHVISFVSRTLWELCTILTDVIWLAFVDQKLYGSLEKRSVRHVSRFAIVVIYIVMLIINIFTGFIFKINSDSSFQRTPVYNLMIFVDFALFCSAALAVWVFDRRSTKVRFLRVAPMIVSLLAFILPQFFTPYNTGIIGHVIGLTFLYISLVSELRFIDDESGLYNKNFMTFMYDMAIAEKDDFHSVIKLETEGDLQEGFKILRDVLHRKGDVIRVEERKFLLFSTADNLSALQYRLSPLDVAVDRHNTKYPDKKVNFTARSRIRSENESALDFVRTAADEHEAGSEMRGIASMITDLNRLDQELSMAADIQMNNLPMNFPPFPEYTQFELYASMTPAKEVGGDFYDFFLVDKDHLGLVIADVSGKGIPAALFMMVSKSLLKNNLITGCTPAEAVEKANNQLCEHNTAMMFVTVWIAVIEISTGKGTAVNAGHEKPVLCRSGKMFEILDYEHDVFLGVVQGMAYTPREFELHPGDTLFVYTDGVVEATNDADMQYGEERLVRALNSNPDSAPEELISEVHWRVNEFVGDAPQFDDITMLCLKYNG